VARSPTGFLTLSLLAPTGFEVLLARIAPKSVVNYGLEKVRLRGAGALGQARAQSHQIAAVEPKGGGRYLVTTENTMEIEGETKPALIASVLAMFMEEASCGDTTAQARIRVPSGSKSAADWRRALRRSPMISISKPEVSLVRRRDVAEASDWRTLWL